MWRNTGNIVDSILGRIKEPKWDRLMEAWEKIEGVQEMGEPVRLSKGALVIKVKNSAYLQMLNMRREEITQCLNKSMSGEIKNIRFQVS